MTKLLNRLNSYYVTCLLSLFLILITFFCLIPLYFNGLNEIPQGLMLGCFINILFFFILGLLDKNAIDNLSNKGTIAVMIIRFLVLGGILALITWLYYQQNVKIFNVFAFVGGYIIPTVVMMVLMIFSGKRNSDV